MMCAKSSYDVESFGSRPGSVNCSPLARLVCVLCVGLSFCVLGMVSYAVFEPVLRFQVEKNLVIDPANEIYQNWVETPIPVYVKLYLFNYTNPDDILRGAKPKLDQLGPFVYWERRKKTDIRFNGNGTVSYRQTQSYEYLPHLSVGSLEDSLYTLNVPMIAAAYKNRKTAPNEEEPMASAINNILNRMNQTIFVEKRVRELLFEGYEDQMLTIAEQWGWSPTSRFGYQVGRNNSRSGVYTIFTGADNMANYGTVESFNGRKRIMGFRKWCTSVNGTTGEMWPPFTLSPEKSLSFFVPPLCRSLRLDFVRNETVKDIQVSRYHLDERLFDYSIEDNQCFCSKKKHAEPECMPNGLLDLNRCQPEAPLVASLPHLLYADPAVAAAVEGLAPDPEHHGFFMDVQPSMGVPLRVAARLQMNVIVDSFRYFKQFEVFPSRVFLPTFWTETSSEVDDGLAFKLRLVTRDLKAFVWLTSLIWVLIGLAISVFALGYALARNRRSHAV